MKNQFKKACVTGGAGFIGSHLVRALLDEGMSVVVLDNLSVGKSINVPAGARLVKGDILDQDLVSEAVAGCDIVFHLAARVAIRSSFEFAHEDMTVNAAGAASLLAAAVRAKSVRKVITTSSMAVYAEADHQTPIAEDYRTSPISPYGVSKLAAEQLTHLLCARAGIESIALRLFNTYGPGQRLSPYVGVMTIFVNALGKGESPTIFGDGNQCRDFVHVKDVVAGFMRAMAAQVTGETFNIGTGVPISVNAVIRSLNKVMKRPLPGRHVEPARGELRYSVADISKARKMLGYEPAYEFDAALPDVVDEMLRFPSY
jgi:UDP-glucose 4-epimerase